LLIRVRPCSSVASPPCSSAAFHGRRVTRYRAAWVLPMSSPPIRSGVVSVQRDLIVGVNDSADGEVTDLGSVAILPGLVNAHTHLELSWMRGQVPPGGSMTAWGCRVRRGAGCRGGRRS